MNTRLIPARVPLTDIGRILCVAHRQPDDRVGVRPMSVVIAVLFNPLRLRLQYWIHRRFYRRCHNATQALQTFAVTARTEVDVDEVDVDELEQEQTMQRFDTLSRKLAGVMLILGPALIVLAAVLKALEIGTSTGRWYDSAPEGFVMALGFSLQLIGLLGICRGIGRERPILGLVATVTSVIGSAGTIFPASVRILGASMLGLGFTVDQLDPVFGGTDAASSSDLYVAPFLLVFFINFLVLAFGIWRTKLAPLFVPILLVAGTILFPVAQTPFEVNVPIYLAATVLWFLGLAPLGMAFLRAPATGVQD